MAKGTRLGRSLQQTAKELKRAAVNSVKSRDGNLTAYSRAQLLYLKQEGRRNSSIFDDELISHVPRSTATWNSSSKTGFFPNECWKICTTSTIFKSSYRHLKRSRKDVFLFGAVNVNKNLLFDHKWVFFVTNISGYTSCWDWCGEI